MKEMNVRYQNQGDYQLPCITTKEQNELYIGVWANRHRQYLKQHHRIRYYNLLTTERLYPFTLRTSRNRHKQCFRSLSNRFPKKKMLRKN